MDSSLPVAFHRLFFRLGCYGSHCSPVTRLFPHCRHLSLLSTCTWWGAGCRKRMGSSLASQNPGRTGLTVAHPQCKCRKFLVGGGRDLVPSGGRQFQACCLLRFNRYVASSLCFPKLECQRHTSLFLVFVTHPTSKTKREENKRVCLPVCTQNLLDSAKGTETVNDCKPELRVSIPWQTSPKARRG